MTVFLVFFFSSCCFSCCVNKTFLQFGVQELFLVSAFHTVITLSAELKPGRFSSVVTYIELHSVLLN